MKHKDKDVGEMGTSATRAKAKYNSKTYTRASILFKKDDDLLFTLKRNAKRHGMSFNEYAKLLLIAGLNTLIANGDETVD